MKDFCKYCFNDPVIHNCQKELCGVCEMETEVAKRKKTRADKIRSLSDENLAQFIVDVAGPKDKAKRAILINYVKAWLQEEDDE